MRSSSPADGGVDGAQPLQDTVRVLWLQVGGQEGWAGQVCQCTTADVRFVLGPIVARQKRSQGSSAPSTYRKEHLEIQDSNLVYSALAFQRCVIVRG